MRLDDLAIDVEAIENGEWRDAEGLPGIRLKLKGYGNTKWIALESALRRQAPALTPETIHSRCLAEACLLDWSGIEDDEGPWTFSQERASLLVTDPSFRKVRASIFATAIAFGDETLAARKDRAAEPAQQAG